MASTSPLFQSSFDLFSHSIEHFNSGTERDRKFVIMHLANAVELVLKDLMLDLGLSIYKNPKETVTISGAIDTLQKEKNIKIPHLNKLELLIDERNALQHRYGFPNELTTIFYMEATYTFFKDFLHENYSLDVEKVLEEFLHETDMSAFKLRSVKNHSELNKLGNLSKVHPVGALLSASAYLERKLSDILKIISDRAKEVEKPAKGFLFRLPTFDTITRLMIAYEIDLDKRSSEGLTEFRMVRNMVAHGRSVVNSKQVMDFIEISRDLEPKLAELKEKVIKNPDLLLE
jgi:uncharacterized protein YutE (UPF0331/DUF86 family)